MAASTVALMVGQTVEPMVDVMVVPKVEPMALQWVGSTVDLMVDWSVAY